MVMSASISYVKKIIVTQPAKLYAAKTFSIAPMLDWTDRHCRFLHRLFTRHTLLYTEMVVADAAIHGKRDRLLGFSEQEHPVALQLGGSDPVKLAESAKIGAGFGYDEINLNVGCPSDRVQSGAFGACLMLTPQLVADCVAAMKQVVNIPVTVKCRIGVDDQDQELALSELSRLVLEAGADALWVHARKAWLQGLSPKENRDIPPLDYDRVYRLKQDYPHTFIGINGGITTIDETAAHLQHLDGVMMGRAAYHTPMVLRDVDRVVYGDETTPLPMEEVLDIMCAYADQHIAEGGRLTHVTRHMVGMFQGQAGSRRWRQILSTDATRNDADSKTIRKAYQVMCETAAEVEENLAARAEQAAE